MKSETWRIISSFSTLPLLLLHPFLSNSSQTQTTTASTKKTKPTTPPCVSSTKPPSSTPLENKPRGDSSFSTGHRTNRSQTRPPRLRLHRHAFVADHYTLKAVPLSWSCSCFIQMERRRRSRSLVFRGLSEVVCERCGSIAIANLKNNSFECRRCKNKTDIVQFCICLMRSVKRKTYSEDEILSVPDRKAVKRSCIKG